jgi:hypothetical protein
METVETSTRSWQNITQAIFDCVVATSAKEHGTIYNPPGADSGTATTNTPVGSVVVGFTFDPLTEVLTYTILKKPFVVPDSQIWSGINGTIEGCSGRGSRP